jgi:hypothetical protein
MRKKEAACRGQASSLMADCHLQTGFGVGSSSFQDGDQSGTNERCQSVIIRKYFLSRD